MDQGASWPDLGVGGAGRGGAEPGEVSWSRWVCEQGFLTGTHRDGKGVRSGGVVREGNRTSEISQMLGDGEVSTSAGFSLPEGRGTDAEGENTRASPELQGTAVGIGGEISQQKRTSVETPQLSMHRAWEPVTPKATSTLLPDPGPWTAPALKGTRAPRPTADPRAGGEQCKVCLEPPLVRDSVSAVLSVTAHV